MASKRIHIPIHLQPYKPEDGLYIVEKTDGEGKKKRYLRGVTSGLMTDGHGERMTKKAIDNMQEQANSGSILLYEGQHGVTHTDDVGILVKSEITSEGDWVTEYRLYDETDDVGPNTAEKVDKLWKQVNGLPPYVDANGSPKPLTKGFSVEGYIPDGGILKMSDSGQRVIDRVDLDGVLVTPRPSYKTSVIAAVYKALDELSPRKRIHVSENIRGKFINKIEDEKQRESYYSKRFKLEDALNESIDEIMENGLQVKDRLELLFDEYKTMMIQLIMDHNKVFVRPPEQPDVPDDQGEIDVAKSQRLRLLKSIQEELRGYVDLKSQQVQKSQSIKETRNEYRSKRRNRRRGKTSN